MKYITVAEASKKWGLTPRSVQLHCLKGNVPGATLQGKSWRIPIDAVRPLRKPRAGKMPTSVLAALKAEKRGRLSGGLYHRLQIDFTYNSNHIEGCRLTHEQTRWIFETKTIGNLPTDIPVDDIVETANHFRCVDIVIESAGAALTERYIKRLHAQLKSGTSDSRNVISDSMWRFYYLGLQEWRQGSRERLLDTCRAGQDVFVLGLRKFGYDKLAGRAGAERT